ncbi:toxin-antitoxin module transcriptional modulator MazE [Psychroflexus torquis ATCC 700755]|jgi:antitoxin MazE|uniref:Toxin-antitoxin module transcriptional modulator MazE n=1 Tax=Psychroflexus torquis (strain ATCC 700755 / CIP 106069 / ACAM 623) TaxID=313595 RepID=K4IAV4_PSYTT|nr:AbrB/MazE/SpoVT family DNA-binding domain-containing protein [Psychroflexus torquis]AFU67752.1 toxin-antitoxin module transcriptional modulator MazE [Psychroflexus torquis ATCC 700755]
METTIIKIGNSKGLRLSKTILEKYNIKDKVEMILEEGQIILKPISSPRKNWGKAFEEMRKNNDDLLLFNDVFEDENFEEWN